MRAGERASIVGVGGRGRNGCARFRVRGKRTHGVGGRPRRPWLSTGLASFVGRPLSPSLRAPPARPKRIATEASRWPIVGGFRAQSGPACNRRACGASRAEPPFRSPASPGSRGAPVAAWAGPGCPCRRGHRGRRRARVQNRGRVLRWRSRSPNPCVIVPIPPEAARCPPRQGRRGAAPSIGKTRATGFGHIDPRCPTIS